jgi:hypothetical protein
MNLGNCMSMHVITGLSVDDSFAGCKTEKSNFTHLARNRLFLEEISIFLEVNLSGIET